MKSKRILALMLGAIIASGSVSQAAMQVYADLEDSSSSESISESVPEITEAEQLKKMTNLSGSKLEDLYQFINIKEDHLYTSDSKLVFELVKDKKARLVCYDGDQSDVTVPQYVSIDGNDYPVTSIHIGAFYRCYNLETIVLPKDLKKIGSEAFYNCTNLRSIVLPKNLEKIGCIAFYHCESLKSIYLPENLKEIAAGTFQDCFNLKSIVLPKNLKKIGNYAFAGTNISDITIPASVTTLGKNALEAEKLKSVLVDEKCTLSDSDIQKACGRYSINVQIHRDINMDTLAYFAVGQGYRGINPF